MTNLDGREPLISFIVTCKGRLDHLMVSLPRLIGQRYSKIILVDSECPDGVGDWAETQFNQITVVRIQDQGQFHLARARNEGLKSSSTEWVCFVDADIVLSTEVGDRVTRILDQNSFYLFQKASGRRGTNGSCLARREHLMKIGGYDEAIKGWGGEDKDLYWRLENLGVAKKFLSHELIDAVIDHPNELRTRFSEQKSASAIHLDGR